MGYRVYPQVNRRERGEVAELLKRHRPMQGLRSGLLLQTLEQGFQLAGPAASVCGQQPLAQRSQGPVTGRLPLPVVLGEAASVFERPPALSGNPREEVVDPVPPVRCAQGGRVGDDEDREWDRFTAHEVRGFA